MCSHHLVPSSLTVSAAVVVVDGVGIGEVAVAVAALLVTLVFFEGCSESSVVQLAKRLLLFSFLVGYFVICCVWIWIEQS